MLYVEHFNYCSIISLSCTFQFINYFNFHYHYCYSLRYAQAEHDNKAMRELVNTLRITNDEREAVIQSESDARRRAEGEVQIRSTALDRAQRELTKTTTRASSLRQECRRAKRLVDDAANQMRELVNAVRSDAMAVGVELQPPDAKSSQFARITAGAVPSTVGGDVAGAEDGEVSGDILGINELTEALNSIRSVLAWIQDIPRERLDLEAQVCRCDDTDI